MLDFTRQRLHAAHNFFAASTWQQAASQARDRASLPNTGLVDRARATGAADCLSVLAAFQGSTLLAPAQVVLRRADAFAAAPQADTARAASERSYLQQAGRAIVLAGWVGAAVFASSVHVCSLSLGSLVGAGYGGLHALAMFLHTLVRRPPPAGAVAGTAPKEASTPPKAQASPEPPALASDLQTTDEPDERPPLSDASLDGSFLQEAPPAYWVTSNDSVDAQPGFTVSVREASSSSDDGWRRNEYDDAVEEDARSQADSAEGAAASSGSEGGFESALFCKFIDTAAVSLLRNNFDFPHALTRAARHGPNASKFQLHDAAALTLELDFVLTRHLRRAARSVAHGPNGGPPPKLLLSCDTHILPDEEVKQRYGNPYFTRLLAPGADLLEAVQRHAFWQQAEGFVRRGGLGLTAALAQQCGADLRWMQAIMAFTENEAIDAVATALQTSTHCSLKCEDAKLAVPSVSGEAAFFFLERSREEIAVVQLGYLHHGGFDVLGATSPSDPTNYRGTTYVGLRLCIPRPDEDGRCWPNIEQVWLASNVATQPQLGTEADLLFASDPSNDSDTSDPSEASYESEEEASDETRRLLPTTSARKAEETVWFI